MISIATVVKTYGQPLKAACAMVRLRLYDALSLVPPQYYEGIYVFGYLLQSTLLDFSSCVFCFVFHQRAILNFFVYWWPSSL